ncbi:unnamed protein product [Kuraishia capsulata CBS 1993]|uniref:t-SNARE coiled-coil homology domain-containing protein n=1 Tax=Kuraishia capsulata CBS 1993 TaxID=1382522 RepID=W6MQW6_9ASCO|nr:uncharacterized protein KUCA_T00000235001 [Kuraishia capsulata CBS 1993]CDK24275.1 unnamed protein product [Kuraishia capsulata CBS 1993]
MSFANIDIESQKQKVGLIDSTSNLTTTISQKLSSFVGLVSKFDKVQQQLGTKRDNTQLRNSASELVRQCDVLEGQLNKHLTDLSTGLLKGSADPQLRYTEEKLQKEGFEIFKNYQRILRQYEEKLNSVTVSEQFSKNTESTNTLNASETTPLLVQQQQQQQLQEQAQETGISNAELEYHATLLEQRSDAVARIQDGVEDINAIFKDLGAMVQQQGQSVDTIEDNLLTYANNNQAASHELSKADAYQKKKRKWSCVTLVLLVVVLLITLAVIS